MSRVRGSLFQVDNDGWVRNTYMLRVTNKSAVEDPIQFTGSRWTAWRTRRSRSQPIALASTESRVIPLIVRIPPIDPMQRTMPMTVKVASPTASVTSMHLHDARSDR